MSPRALARFRVKRDEDVSSSPPFPGEGPGLIPYPSLEVMLTARPVLATSARRKDEQLETTCTVEVSRCDASRRPPFCARYGASRRWFAPFGRDRMCEPSGVELSASSQLSCLPNEQNGGCGRAEC
eukprot:scaffold80745_cov62-Phaeocystis_antarctica.AAC.3